MNQAQQKLTERIAYLETALASVTEEKFVAIDIARHARRRLFRLELAYSILRKRLTEIRLVWISRAEAEAAVQQADAIYAPPKHMREPGVHDA